MVRKHLHGRGEDPLCQYAHVIPQGNTSTDVEKTRKASRDEFPVAETPPRTWRRRVNIAGQLAGFRNTSTDVEKTAYDFGAAIVDKKHLHGRGEDSKI